VGRIIAFDIGSKRTGIAVTDANKIIATALTTIASNDVVLFLKNFMHKEEIDSFVIGEPKQMNNKASQSSKTIDLFEKLLYKNFPDIPVIKIDERFTSKMAFQTMIDSGINRKHRQDKSLVDKISATIILQSFLEMRKNNLI